LAKTNKLNKLFAKAFAARTGKQVPGGARAQHVDHAEACLKPPWHKDRSAVDSHGQPPATQSADDSWKDSLAGGRGWPATVNDTGSEAKGKGKGMASMADDHYCYDWSSAHNPQSNAAVAAAADDDDNQPQEPPEVIFKCLADEYAVDRRTLRVPGLAQIRNADVRELVNVCGGRVHTG
jgi:hypothetical protein